MKVLRAPARGRLNINRLFLGEARNLRAERDALRRGTAVADGEQAAQITIEASDQLRLASASGGQRLRIDVPGKLRAARALAVEREGLLIELVGTQATTYVGCCRQKQAQHNQAKFQRVFPQDAHQQDSWFPLK